MQTWGAFIEVGRFYLAEVDMSSPTRKYAQKRASTLVHPCPCYAMLETGISTAPDLAPNTWASNRSPTKRRVSGNKWP